MDKAKGRAKEAAGSLTGDQDRKAEGRREGPRELIARRLPSTLGPGRSSLGPLSARSRTPEAAGERTRGILEFLIWMGIGTGGGLVIAVIFFVIARYLNAKDAGKEAKPGERSSGG